MPETITIDQAYWAVSNPATDAATLQAIAAHYRDLWPKIAAHPNASPALLDWLDASGDPAARAAVAARRPAPMWAPAAQSVVTAPPVVGASTAGAITGGALMLLLVLLAILDRTVFHLFGIAFGTLPGMDIYLDNCDPEATCSGGTSSLLYLISFIIVTLVWAGLGVAILVGAKRHLAKVALAGLCAVVLFNTLPELMWVTWLLTEIIRNSPSPLIYLSLFSACLGSLLLPTSLLLVVLAARRGQLKHKVLLTWAIILLCLSVLYQIYESLAPYLNWHWGMDFWWVIILQTIASAAMLVPWLIVTATAYTQTSTSPALQPTWRPVTLGTS